MPSPVIDFHTHYFPDALAPRAVGHLLATTPEARCWTDGTLAGLRLSMARGGITKAVALPVATKASQVSTINRDAAALAATDVVAFGTLHPAMTNWREEISFIASYGIRGIKLHPEFQDFYLDAPAMFPLYEMLAEAHLILVLHAGKDPGPFTNDHSTPAAIAGVGKRFPSLIIVAAHMGGHGMWDEVERHLIGQPILFDTSTAPEFLPKDEFVRLCRKHGIDRILFGSDSPWFDQSFDRKWVAESGLTDNELELVFHGNAERVLEG